MERGWYCTWTYNIIKKEEEKMSEMGVELNAGDIVWPTSTRGTSHIQMSTRPQHKANDNYCSQNRQHLVPTNIMTLGIQTQIKLPHLKHT